MFRRFDVISPWNVGNCVPSGGALRAKTEQWPADFAEARRSGMLFMPVIYRPLFDYLRMVTCRTFETPAANTIPLFTQDRKYVEEIFGEEALELTLPDERPQDKILGILRRPERYARIAKGIRRRLAERHSYELRLRELIEIVKS